MESYVRFVVRRRFLVLVLLGLLTVASGVVCSFGRIGTSLGTLFLGESPAFQRYKERAQLFGSDEVVVIAFEDDNLLSTDTLSRLRAVVDRVADIKEVARVDSVLDARRISGDGETLKVTAYADEALARPARARELLAELVEDPFARGLVVSTDGRSGAVMVELKWDDTRPAERGPLIIAEIEKIFVEEGFAQDRLHRIGVMAVLSEIVDQTQFNLSRLFPFVLVILLVVVWVMFRRLWPVLITGGVGAVSVAWTMAFSILLDPNISILAAMVPAVVLIVSFSDVIHLCSAYLLELSRDKPKAQAIRDSGADVGKACLFTSLTTFAGFVSLSLIPAPVFRLLGLVLGFGVGVALLLAMTLSPIMFSFMRQPKPWRTGRKRSVQGVLDGFLKAVERVATGRPRSTVAAFAVLLALSIAGLTQLEIDTDFTKRLDEENRVRQDEKYFEDNFGGSLTIEFYIDTPEEGGLLDPERYALIADFIEELEQMPEIDRAASIVEVLDRVHREMAPPGKRGRPPGSRELLAQYLLLFEMSSEGYDLDRLIDFDRKTMRILASVPGKAVRESYETGCDAFALAGPVLAAGVEVEPTGGIYLIGHWLENIVAGQRNGILVAFLSIAVMMMIGLASVRAGLWSMVPNLLPLLALGGYVGFAYDKIDSDALALGMIAIGIGVDDTIHFLMRLRLESARTDNVKEALARAFHFSGRAIVITTVVLVAGFSPFVLSDYFPLRIFGTLLPFCLVVALVADLFLVTALARLGIIRFRNGGGER